jgi:hypothetical protein
MKGYIQQIAFQGNMKLKTNFFEDGFRNAGGSWSKSCNNDVIKSLRKFMFRRQFMVHPFWICKEEICFVLDPAEVSSIIELPLSVFLNDEILIKAKMLTSMQEINVHLMIANVVCHHNDVDELKMFWNEIQEFDFA